VKPRRQQRFLDFCLVVAIALIPACGGGDGAADGGGAATYAGSGTQDAGAPIDRGSADVWPVPTYWSAEATKTIDDIAFVFDTDPLSGKKKKFFALGFDNHSKGPWDGVTGRDGCGTGENGEAIGWIDNAVDLNESAFSAGANFAYVWGSGREKLGATGGKIRGIYHNNWGIDPAPENDVVPIIYNGAGESDMDEDRAAKIKELKDRFATFKARTGDYAADRAPNLVPYPEMPWFAWHPTWRSNGGGSGGEERTTDSEADAFSQATTMMIGDNYTYVTNKYDSSLNPITGQKGEKDEGYDYWLEKDDPDHRSHFAAAWEMVWNHVERARKGFADPAFPTVNWAWMQGYAFDDGIGASLCWDGKEDSWAKGGFPTAAYLRKEITSTIVAGGTGIVFFGYFYSRFPDADKTRQVFRALSHPDVYEPALLSPRLDLGIDTQFLGKAGYDGKGKAHVLVKWHDESKTAFVIGANPGARATPFSLEFPWTIEKAEILDWGLPAPSEADKNAWTPPAFIASSDLAVYDKKLSFTAPIDEGFIIRISPLAE